MGAKNSHFLLYLLMTESLSFCGIICLIACTYQNYQGNKKLGNALFISGIIFILLSGVTKEYLK